MIISASRRTDIPAFYAEWFMQRLRERYVLVQNPFNANTYSRIDLSPENVDAIVFWTKNPRPLLRYLSEIDNRGYGYYIQFTLTGYPKTIEPSLPELNEVISTFKELSDTIGRNKVIWRYDPVILSDITDMAFVVDNFEALAKTLSGFTGRVVISFADFYKKVTRNLERARKDSDIAFYDIHLRRDEIYNIASRISTIAHNYSLAIQSCAEKIDLSRCGINPGKCIDDGLLNALFGLSLHIAKDKYQRKECGCVESKDIGHYNSCTHDCIYCYANNDRKLARKNKARHDPSSPTLIGNALASEHEHDSR